MVYFCLGTRFRTSMGILIFDSSSSLCALLLRHISTYMLFDFLPRMSHSTEAEASTGIQHLWTSIVLHVS
jgi:hypothetical protein